MVELAYPEAQPEDQTDKAGDPGPVAAAPPDFSKVDGLYDSSKDDYESIPAGAQKTTRAKVVKPADRDEFEADDDHGRRIVWWDADKRQKYREDRWLNGVCHGVRLAWHQNGAKWGEETLIQGQRRGELLRWCGDGAWSRASSRCS